MRKKIVSRVAYALLLGLIFGLVTVVLVAFVSNGTALPFKSYEISNCGCIGNICPMCAMPRRQIYLEGLILNSILFAAPWSLLWFMILSRKKYAK